MGLLASPSRRLGGAQSSALDQQDEQDSNDQDGGSDAPDHDGGQSSRWP